MDSLGNRLKAWRQASGYTQEDAASIAHVERGTWSNYERGRRIPDATVLARLGSPEDVAWIVTGVRPSVVQGTADGDRPPPPGTRPEVAGYAGPALEPDFAGLADGFRERLVDLERGNLTPDELVAYMHAEIHRLVRRRTSAVAAPEQRSAPDPETRPTPPVGETGAPLPEPVER